MWTNNKNRIWFTLIMAIGVLATIAYGRKYWVDNREVFFGKLYAPHDYVLLTSDGKIFDTGKVGSGRILYVFMPDILQQVHVRAAAAFFLQIKNVPNLRLVAITRSHKDNALNFLRASGFRGELVLDPSGSFAKNFKIWLEPKEVLDWKYIVLEGGRKLLLQAAGEDPIPYAEFKKSAPLLFR